MIPEQLLLVFGIVLLGVLVVNILSNITSELKEPEELVIQKKECKLHDWATHEETDKLICCNCGKFAGIIDND
jgi:hypothetical protein